MPAAIAAGRRWWRQLTSMRTALLLLFLLAVAAVPGSVFPQSAVSPAAVAVYRADNPRLSVWLDQLGMFEVYAAPWFTAIYLLLMVSLIGCLLPRLRDQLSAVRRRPADAPRTLSRLPAHAELGVTGLDPQATGTHLAAVLRRQHFRVAVRGHDDATVTVAAERGHLREAGNLVFHFSVLVLLAGVAVGQSYRWTGNRLLVAGPENAFCTSAQQFDEYELGPRLTTADLPAYCLQLREFTATFLDNGQPTGFRADITWATRTGTERPYTLQVNKPLRLEDATIYLLGHGYAPQLRYTDRSGRAETRIVPFLPADNMHTSDGVVLFPDANADPGTGNRSSQAQMAFSGNFLPTAGPDGRSQHPDLRDPAVTLTAYRGDLGLDDGVPQTVYALPQRPLTDGRLQRLGDTTTTLRPGQSWKLDDGSTLQLLGVRRFITIAVRDDPGQPVVLGAAITLLAGLTASLSVRRRRIWFRVTPATGTSTVEAAGLPRLDYASFAAEFEGLCRQARKAASISAPERRP